MAFPSRLLGGALHRLDGSVVGAASADQIGERSSDLAVGRMGIAGEQFGPRHDPAIDAIGALIHLLLDPGSLELVRLLRRAETGERGDLALCDCGHRRDARPNRLTVDMHGAGAALPQATTKAWIV